MEKIVKILLNVASLQKQINTENPFTNDFIKFLERRFPEWFPSRLLQNISFPKDESDPNSYYLNDRLNRIKNQIYGNESIEERIGKFNRYIIKVKFGWINEIQIEPAQKDSKNFIAIRLHIGDTKEQGQYFFRKNPQGINWSKEIDGYQTTAEPYIKFSNNWASALLWVGPTLEESKSTHNLSFFNKYAKKHKRNEWKYFIKDLEQYVTDWKNKCYEANWKNKCEWDYKLENSNRNVFLLSIGTLFTVYLPYEDCQKFDHAEINPQIVDRIRKIINEIKQTVD